MSMMLWEKPDPNEKSNARVEDPIKAEEEARQIQAEFGGEIDKGVEHLKIAQAFGLKDEIEKARKEIRSSVGKGIESIESDRWAPVLKSMTESVLREPGTAFNIFENDLRKIPGANLQQFWAFLSTKFQGVELKAPITKIERGVEEKIFWPGRYLFVEGTDLIIKKGEEGVGFWTSPKQAAALKEFIRNQEPEK